MPVNDRAASDFSEIRKVVYLHPYKGSESLRGADVERINPYGFFDFGKEIGAVIEQEGEIPAPKAFWILFQAREAMTRLISGKPIPIGISKAKAQAVIDAITPLFNDRFMANDVDGKPGLRFPEPTDPPVPAWQWQWIAGSIKNFEAISLKK